MSRVSLGVSDLMLLFSQKKKTLRGVCCGVSIYYSSFYKYDYCDIKIYLLPEFQKPVFACLYFID